MIDTSIHDRDYVIVQFSDTPHRGDVVVALVDNFEAKLKRYNGLPNQQIKLVLENSTMQPISFPANLVLNEDVVVRQS